MSLRYACKSRSCEQGGRVDRMKILNNRMDKLMPEFETSNPDFFQEYFDARMIGDSGTGKKKEAAQRRPYQKQKSPVAIAGAFSLVAGG